MGPKRNAHRAHFLCARSAPGLRPGYAFGLPDNKTHRRVIEGARNESASRGCRDLRSAYRLRLSIFVSCNVPATCDQCHMQWPLRNAYPVQMPAQGTGPLRRTDKGSEILVPHLLCPADAVSRLRDAICRQAIWSLRPGPKPAKPAGRNNLYSTCDDAVPTRSRAPP